MSPTYKSWQAMKYRCHKRAGWADRGFEVCPNWLTFEGFLADMGERPTGLTLDRTNNDGAYWCGHCEWCVANGHPRNGRWATRSEQQRNRRWKGRNQYVSWGTE